MIRWREMVDGEQAQQEEKPGADDESDDAGVVWVFGFV